MNYWASKTSELPKPLKYWTTENIEILMNLISTGNKNNENNHTNKSVTQPWTEGELDADDFFHLWTFFAKSSTTTE